MHIHASPSRVYKIQDAGYLIQCVHRIVSRAKLDYLVITECFYATNCEHDIGALRGCRIDTVPP